MPFLAPVGVVCDYRAPNYGGRACAAAQSVVRKFQLALSTSGPRRDGIEVVRIGGGAEQRRHQLEAAPVALQGLDVLHLAVGGFDGFPQQFAAGIEDATACLTLLWRRPPAP